MRRLAEATLIKSKGKNMGYNSVLYKRIYDEYTSKYLIARARADERRAELHRAIPELAAIDKRLSGAGLQIFSAALSGDYKKSLEDVKQANRELQARRRELLISNGYPEDYSDVKYECNICKDSGFVDNKMCSCMKQALVLATLEESGLSSLVREQDFDSFSLDYYKKSPQCYELMKHNKEFLVSYAESFGSSSQSILLMGGTGLGKTHISSAIARKVIEKGNDVLYTGIIDLISTFEDQRFKGYASEDTGEVDRYFDCDLLIIDDLGTELINQFSVSTLYNLINTRISKRKPTIISTNLSQKDIQQKYTDRITSRIFGEYIVLPFMGEDVRKQKLMK